GRRSYDRSLAGEAQRGIKVFVMMPLRDSRGALMMNEVVGCFILDSSMTRDPKRRTVDGRLPCCGAKGDHVKYFGRSPTAVCLTDKIARPTVMLNSIMESPVPSRESPLWNRSTSRREET